MKYLVRPWRRPVARVLVLAIAVGSAPVYCLAAEPPGPPRSTPTLAASIQTAVQHEVGKVAKVSPSAARQAGGASSAGPSSGSFFKSRAGVVTVVLLAVGTGFALYSTSHDRVTSPNQSYGGTK